jgi:TRAP-type C4-dicarboxylate transport system substrate-binding protein
MSLYNLYFIWAMNKEKYEGLPDDLKAVIAANSGFDASAWAGRAHDLGDADGKALMEDSGNEIAQVSAAETAKMQALGIEVVTDWIADMAAKGYDSETLIQDARAAVQVTRNAPAPAN